MAGPHSRRTTPFRGTSGSPSSSRPARLPRALARSLIGLLLLAAWPADAASILAVVSPRNAADVLGGAHRFLDEEPDHELALRSTEQLTALDRGERRRLLAAADIIFAGGVFGTAAERLLGDLDTLESFVALHGDPRLTAASHLEGRPLLAGADMDALMAEPPPEAGIDVAAWVDEQLAAHPEHTRWLVAKLFWSGRGTANANALMRHLATLSGETLEVPAPVLQPSLRAFVGGRELAPDALQLDDARRWVAVLDHETGDRPGETDLHRALCERVEARGHGCLSLLADWGEASVAAVRLLARHAGALGAIVSLQDFVIGAGEGRERIDAELAALDVPVLKGIRLAEVTRAEWELSEEGLPQDSVHYRIAMPELQGVSQPLVVSAMAPATIDPRTGLALALPTPIEAQVALLGRRVERWLTLQDTPENERRVAIVYYNHPPGRHNIGADNLNVPASLLGILERLRDEGYETGPLPDTEEALLDQLQARGVNLPEDRAALDAMAPTVANVDADAYAEWFDALPDGLRDEMVSGPLGYLRAQMRRAMALDAHDIARALLERVVHDLEHALEGADHPARERALDLLSQLETSYIAALEAETSPRASSESASASPADRSASNETAGADESNAALARADELATAIVATGIEGVRGWGEPPGRVMVHDGSILLPGIRFGNVFVGPQPPRGWELNEELLHANLSFPPTHQYLAFYRWIRDSFEADAVVHLGRHSTLEFLPRHRAGLGDDDYPLALLDDLPNVYPYIVDGVGEGIQAKRRAMAVMVDHLTPPLESTALYDRLLELRQLIESHEAAPASAVAMRKRATAAIMALVDELELEEELLASMSGELEVRGITDVEQVDEELLVHEIGHYLTKLQEDFMPLGLHAFGRPWTDEAVETMLRSMARDPTTDAPDDFGESASSDAPGTSGAPAIGGIDDSAFENDSALENVGDGAGDTTWRESLVASPAAEMDALLGGLSGRYVRPGKGNDPIRTPEVLPTGRNFFALDGGLVPSGLGYRTGVELATRARARTASASGATSGGPAGQDRSARTNGVDTTSSGNNRGDRNADSPSPADADADAVVLWASDVVRDEGAMIAFGLDMLGIRPVWSSRGIVRGLERLDVGSMNENGAPRVRRDAVFTTSGLFRDLYGEQLVRLEQAVLMALDASTNVIRRDYPALAVALDAALAPLGEARDPGDEPLELNRVAARWTRDAALALREGIDAVEAGRTSAHRVFGDAPGAYGAGVNRMVERSGSWEERGEVAATYLRRMGHAYGAELHGEPRHAAFERRLASVGNTWAGQSSNLYGLLDNNDMFDYLGGLSLAVEHVRGAVPENFVLKHADGDDVRVEPLAAALMSELRGRFLNPQWLVPLMEEGYAGARTMGSEFVEYLWGWQVTNPEIVRDWAWEEVKRVYVDDAHGIGLDTFLEEGHNVHVKSNLIAVMLVAAQKAFWDADERTLGELAERYVSLVVANGLPGSGHTAADHPLHDWLESYVSAEAYARLRGVLDAARPDPGAPDAAVPATIAEITVEEPASTDDDASPTAQASSASASEASANESSEAPASAPLSEEAENAGQRPEDEPVARESASTTSATASDERADGDAAPAERYGPIALGALALVLALGWLRGSRAPKPPAHASAAAPER